MSSTIIKYIAHIQYNIIYYIQYNIYTVQYIGTLTPKIKGK